MDKLIKLSETDMRPIIRKAMLSEVSPFPTIYQDQNQEQEPADKKQARELMEWWERVRKGMERNNPGAFGRALLVFLKQQRPKYYARLVNSISEHFEEVKQKGPSILRWKNLADYMSYLANDDITDYFLTLIEDKTINPEPLTPVNRIEFLKYVKTNRRKGLQPHELKGIDPGQVDKYSYTGLRSYKVNMSESQVTRLVMEVATRLINEAGARFNEQELRRIFEKCSFFPKLKEELRNQFGGDDTVEAVYENFEPGKWLTDSFDWDNSIYGVNYWYEVYERWSDFLENGELKALFGL